MKPSTRKEHDLLGSKKIPQSVRYGIHTARALENFPISGVPIGKYPSFIHSYLEIKKAAAQANIKCTVLEKTIGKAIISACEQLLEQNSYLEDFPVDVYQGGAGTSTNMNFNEVIANTALAILHKPYGAYDIIHPLNHVNASQSTNDTYPSALSLTCYTNTHQLLENLSQLKSSLTTKGREFLRIYTMGRTQLQDAVPIRLGDEFIAFASRLLTIQSLLQNHQKALLFITMGGTAIGTGLNAPKGFNRHFFTSLRDNTQLQWRQAYDKIAQTSDASIFLSLGQTLSTLATTLLKISSDLRLKASGPQCGFSEIFLPELQAGSSIMPGKVNPVIPEMIGQVAMVIIGNTHAIEYAASNAQLQLNAFLPLVAFKLLESFSLLNTGLQLFLEKCIMGILEHEEKCHEYLENGTWVLTALEPKLGHDLCDIIATKAKQMNQSIKTVLLGEKFLSESEWKIALKKKKYSTRHEAFPQYP